MTSCCRARECQRFPAAFDRAAQILTGMIGAGLLLLSSSMEAAVDDRTRVALEALGRMKGADFEGNPALKQALQRVLERVRGEPEFVTLVRDFNLPGQEEALRSFLRDHSDSQVAVDAARLLLGRQTPSELAGLVTGPAAVVVPVVRVLGETDDRRFVPVVLPVLTVATNVVEVRRVAVTALVRVNEGANSLLGLSRSNLLSDDLRFMTGALLRSSRWPAVKAEAEKLFPAPVGKGADPLPPISELLRRTGDAARGAAVFRRADIGCIQCHQVNGEGIDFGPKLSEIGVKLGKDALAEAILDPSAGISFGFEAWSIQLKNGDELTGLITGETEDELSVKTQGGTVTRYKKSEVTRRDKQALSIMPAGLQQNMTTQDFVDLLEYLASLKKATK